VSNDICVIEQFCCTELSVSITSRCTRQRLRTQRHTHTHTHTHTRNRLWLRQDGSLEFNVLFQHKYGYIRDEASSRCHRRRLVGLLPTAFLRAVFIIQLVECWRRRDPARKCSAHVTQASVAAASDRHIRRISIKPALARA